MATQHVSAHHESEEDYGLIRPSLIKQLRSILDQYPDDGQILKELIQNAEDAGASQVGILYDENCHPTQRLHHPGLDKFQGPALYAYNDARFTDKDWTGIRMLQDSVKEKDPMKVGRFGLGFKSVLHMTDLPSVMSGDRLFMIDPHEKYFEFRGDKTSGYSWNLRQKKSAIRETQDQFAPYKTVFGCCEQTFESGHYDGTLFRFPLRTERSDLCETIYSAQRIKETFKSFERDAHNVLLFLKNLESIKLYKRSKNQKDMTLQYEVRLAEKSLDYIRQKRKDFVAKCKSDDNPQGVTLTYLVFVETLQYSETGEAERSVYKWLVNEYKAGANISVQLQELQKDPSLSLVPLIGVAMPVGTPKPDSEDKEAPKPPPEGQVFCFLPLPVEQKTSTGLPAHVNGYFAISQNRRHLKWPTAGHNMKSDKSVYWNQCLIKELLPVSYSQLLLQGIQISKQNQELVSPNDVYNAIPDLVSVDEKWQPFLQPLFTRLFKHPMVHISSSESGSWVEVENVVFDCLKEAEDTRSTVTDVCLRAGVNIAKVPMHILHALGAFSQFSLEVISPNGLRNILRQKPESYVKLERDNKLRLLLYLLKDEDFQDLKGINLLPCGDGTFVQFRHHGEAICIPTHDTPRELFPGLERHLLSSDLPDQLNYKLAKVANEGVCQLQYLDKQAALMLIPKVIPANWYHQEVFITKEGDAVSLAWLEHLWTYLRKQYPQDISMFSGLPILPLNDTLPLRVIPLSLSSTCIMQSAVGVTLEEGLCQMLKVYGVHVIQNLPDFVQSHAAILGNFVKLPFNEDILDALLQTSKKNGNKEELFMKVKRDTSADDKLAFVKLISELKPGNISPPHITFLRNLPVFPTTQFSDDDREFVCVQTVSKAIDTTILPCKISEKLIDASNEEVAKACRLLGVDILDGVEALTNHIFVDIRSGRCDAETVQNVMQSIFCNFSKYSNNQAFLEELSSVAFVTCGPKKLPKKPKDLFDPNDDLLQVLFAEEDGIFPTDSYAEPEMLIYLKKLGLKNSKTLTAKDVLEYIFKVEDMNSKDEITLKKSKACLELINRRSELLWEETQGKLLLEWAADISWVPVRQHKLDSFPTTLNWCADRLTCKPSEVASEEFAPLVGCVKPILATPAAVNIKESFGWNNPPSLQEVLQQLNVIVKCYHPEDKAKFLALLGSIYNFLLHRDCSETKSSLENLSLRKWVWHGDGFTEPSFMIADKLPFDMSPFVYSLPSEMMKFLPLFTAQGVKQKCDVELLAKVLCRLPQVNAEAGEQERNLQMAIDILNLISDQSLSEATRRSIFVPTQTIETGCGFRLLPVSACTYCDVEWIRQGFDLMEFDEQDGIIFIHPNLPVSTASKLGIPTLMSRMLHAEELAITGFGQGEPLTSRLKQLLDDYTDGLAIFKEMIQNADDAGATEISFMFDERLNEDSMKYLIDEGMKECQGPALWVYNNSVFTDEDFTNITKLGGATKEQEPEKIGRFGLGFNSVYNITDVPSFVSRHNIVIFDPHTTHLGKGIKDRSRPGIKIDMTKNKTLLKKLSDQFQPYQDVFNCNVSPENGGNYNGTLFRLPLRTKLQAAKSEISSLHYDAKEMMTLMTMMMKHAHNLLLFTQNLQKVSLLHVPADGQPSNAREIFVLEKEIINTLREQAVVPKSLKTDPKKAGANRMAFLKSAAQYVRNASRPISGRMLTVPQVPQSTLHISTSTKLLSNSLRLEDGDYTSSKHWLVSSCVGQERSKKLSSSSKGSLVPVGGVAIQLKKVEDGYIPQHIDSSVNKALAFCFLPLPVITGLPIHINGTFALESSRRHLSERTDDDKGDQKADWNEALLEDAVTHAYLQALWDIKQILPSKEEVHFYSIWPTFTASEGYFKPLVNSFYKNLSALLQIPLSCRNGTIISMGNAVFLKTMDAMSQQTMQNAIDAFSQCNDGLHVLTPPTAVIESFEVAGYHNIMAEKYYDMQRFYEEVFLPNLDKLDNHVRDSLLIFALQQNNKLLNKLLVESSCIPASPDGSKLRKIDELVHPTGLASRLYIPEDGRFPYGDRFSNGTVLGYLQKLGLKVNDVSWQDLIERAHSMSTIVLKDESFAKSRFHNIMAFIDRKLLQSTKYVRSNTGQKEVMPEDDKEFLKAREELRSIAFLPLMKKPKNYPINWAGDDPPSTELFSAFDLYSKDHRHLVSATQNIADETNMTPRTIEFLNFTQKKVTIEQVMTQLEHVLVVDINFIKDGKEYEELQKALFAIYHYLQDKLAEEDAMAIQLCDILHERPCVLVEDQFKAPKDLALSFQYNCSPYLYSVPQDTVRRFKPLMTALKVKESFSTKTYVEVLQQLHTESNCLPLNERQLDISVRVTSQLNNSMKANNLTADEVVKNYGELYIPNARKILQPSRTLCYNDCPWVTETQIMNFTHPDITFNTSACLGVKTKRQEALSKHAKGIPFGQKERLVNSLKRILSTYPCDHEILKELIQNADDAQATEIHFIRDSRHHSDQHVFENSWKALQGPALCVYNNRPFSVEDLEGIQRLGEGSKSTDPSKTGQYGIGFSSVYHLTDAPSILTESSDVGKTLCVFDPHCYFVPGATPAEPGMRYDNVEQLEKAFPDVFGCYHPNEIDIKDGTMLRFPLRTLSMAEHSKISKQHITMSRIHSMLEKLKNEAFDILLFTNYLEEIKISDIDPLTGKLANTYTVKIILSEAQKMMRAQLAREVKEFGQTIKKEPSMISKLNHTEYEYISYVADNRGKQEKWCIAQSIGFQENTEIPETVTSAFEEGNLALMPRGGVACLLEERLNGQPESTIRKMKAFCFLPLPMHVELPVHINGHFALGHENRRHLWNKTNTNDYKTAWNNLLSSTVISDAYVNLLKAVRLNGLTIKKEDDSFIVTCTRQILNSCIGSYMSCFPSFDEIHPEWNTLVKSVYCSIADVHAPVLPAVQEHEEESEIHGTQWCVKWFPPVGVGSEKAFFSRPEQDSSDHNQQKSFLSRFRSMFKASSQKTTKSDDQILKEVLLECGMTLLEAPPVVVDNFVRSGVEVDFMSPEGVLVFFRSYGLDDSFCKLGTLPCPLADTPFRNEQTLKIILKYCMQDPEFVYKLGGLPLLLTEDMMLRVFDEEDQIFISQFADLMPERADMFMKRSMTKGMFEESAATSCVFKQLSISELAVILSDKLPADRFCDGKHEPIDWRKGFGSVPNENWLKRFWTFVKEETKPAKATDAIDESPIEDGQPDYVHLLEPMKDWCLLPARTTTKHYLYPLGDAADVIYHTQVDYKWYGVRDVLRKLHLPELDVNSINMDLSYNSEVAKSLVTTLDRPISVLNVLHKNFTESKASPELSKDESDRILSYFVQHFQSLQADPSCVNKLRDLPLFTTIYGDVIPLTNCLVYTLPAKIPTQGIDIWQSRSGTVFLERKSEFTALYEVLGCANISVLDVYCKFIFQHLEYFPEDDRMIHLHHVYHKYIKDGASHQTELSFEEKADLETTLTDLPFIPDSSGELLPASEFYDPENVVFRVMLSEDKFPPPPNGSLFKESEWYSFLGKLGLVREMNRDMFVGFAKGIANEGHLQDKNAALAKSKVLVQHLFSMSSASRDNIMPDIKNIQFVTQGTVQPSLARLCPQYGDVGTNTLHFISFNDSVIKDFEKLVWTQAALIPEWADPSKIHSLSSDEKLEIMQGLGMQKKPRLDIVVRNLLELSAHINKQDLGQLRESKTTIKDVFKSMYRYLKNNIDDDPDIVEKLAKEAVLIVQDGLLCVRPCQTVVSLFEGDQIRPYLYRVPVDFGEFVDFFKLLGASDYVTVGQNASVLESIKHKAGINKLTPNDTCRVLKAMKGLLETLEKSSARDVHVSSLYLPNESGHLVDAHKLVFNDAPSFYDRVKEFGMQFVVDPRECGVKSRHAEETLMMLPQRHRPGMLSTYVKEELVEDSKTTMTKEGLAMMLDERVRSEEFLTAVARLVRHDAQKTGQKVEDVQMFEVLDRLSTIHVFGVEKVVTHLTFKGRHIDGSDVEKACFVEKVQGHKSDLCLWNLYIQQDTTLRQDLLVPLAEIINKILSGLLRDSVLYLLPILSCPAHSISKKLDSLNIRLDRVQPTSRTPMLPTLGTDIDESVVQTLVWGEVVFESGEYVGYKHDSRSAVVHARVREEVMSPEDNRVYLVETGSGHDSVIAPAVQLYKYRS